MINHGKDKNFIMKKNIYYSPPLTRDVTCFRLYFDGKNIRQCQMNTLIVEIGLDYPILDQRDFMK